MTSKELEIVLGISKQVGELIEAVSHLDGSVKLLTQELTDIKRQLLEHDTAFKDVADARDVNNLGDTVRKLSTALDDFKEKVDTEVFDLGEKLADLKAAPANAALEASKKLRGALWGIGISLSTGGIGAGLVWMFQALNAASKAVPHGG